MFTKITIALMEFLDDSFIGRQLSLFYAGMFGAVFKFIPSIETWISTNGGYIGFIMYAIAFDFLLGILVCAKKRSFSIPNMLIDLGTKLLAVFGFGVLFEGVKYIHTNQFGVTEWLLYTVRMMIFLYPVFSASKRMSIITGGVFPPKGWFKKMDAFNSELNTKEFTDSDEDYG